MSLTQSCLKTVSLLKSFENITAELIYPKLVVIEDKHNVHILDIEANDLPANSHCYHNAISHHIIHDNLLWLTFKSSEVIVINVFKNESITISNNNYANYNICRFITCNETLYLITDKREYLRAPLITSELNNYFSMGKPEIAVPYEKTQKPNIKNVQKNVQNDVKMYIDSGKIVLKCLITGLSDIIDTNVEMKHISKWNNLVVLASHKNMWLVNEETYAIEFSFEHGDCSFLPLAAYKAVFYYLMCKENEIQICFASLSHGESPLELSSDTQHKSTPQDTIIAQLKSFIHEVITNQEPPEEVLPQVLIYFNKIDDLVFLTTVATKLCNHSILYKPVLYQMQKRIFATDDNNCIELFCDIMIKVDLLEHIHFRGINIYDSNNIFDQNFVELCILFITKSDMDLASICWLKYSEMKPNINASDIVQILNAIPHNIKMGSLIVWFRNFVPNLLEQNPYFIDVFVKWTTDRVFFLEQSSYWPKIGLKFIIAIIEVLETAINTINVRPISIDDLDTLKNHINYIMEIKEKYRINMLLSELSSQSCTEVALIMLRRCYTEDLEAFLRENLTGYASRHLFELDDTLRSFIESEAATSGGSVDGHRLQILLNAFHSSSNKLDCLLQVLKTLDVPWNPIILEMATTAASLASNDFTISENDRILAQEIHKELNYSKIKLILKKYNFPSTCTNYILVINKLIMASEVSVEDLEIVTSTMTAHTNYANILYIDRCLRDCETKKALKYFTNLSSTNKRLLIKAVENKYEQMMTNSRTNSIVERNYLDFLKGSKSLSEIRLKSIENLYHLKNSYSIQMNLNDMFSEKHRQYEASSWKEKCNNIASSVSGKCMMQLLATDMSQNTKVLSQLQRTSTSREIRKVVENLIQPKNENSRSVLSLYKDGENSSSLLDAYDILSELVQNCAEESLHYLLQCLSMLNGLINTNFVLRNLSVAWKFHYIFLPMSSINSLNQLIHFYVDCSTKKISEFDYTNIFNTSDLVPFRIMAEICKMPTNDSSQLNISEIRNKYLTKLVSKILVSQELDALLVTGLLLLLETPEVIEDKMWILELLRGQSETLSPAVMHYLSSPLIRKTFALEYVLPGNVLSFPPQYIIKSKFNINLDDITLPEHNEETWDVKILLFYILKHYPNMSFGKLIEMCRTLNVSESEGLSLLLISLLTNWELKYKVTENDLGLRELVLEENEEDLMTKCSLIWQNIENKDFLKDVLNDFWKSGEVVIHGCHVSINPYYYEIYLCIYQIIFTSSVERNMKEFYLLNFLKYYKRKSAPKQYELESFSIKGMFPEIGYYRLPFHLFNREDMWSNFKSEITLETYESWLPVVAILSLDNDIQTAKDMICSNAVKQTMTTRKQNEGADIDTKGTESWRLVTHEEPLLRTAHRCVKHIANMEWAGACLFYVLQGCARGADQVAAAQLCYQFSQRWASLQPDNRAVRQMERLHSTLSTRHVLHKIEWACEEFLKLTSEPSQLIHALYMHPHLIEKTAKYDINRAANEIADKNGINISSIRIQILENILTKSHNEHKCSASLNIKDLMTAKYILKATCPKMGAIYLSRIAFDDESDHNKCKKLRALQCLMSLIEPEHALKVTNRDRDVLWPSLLDLSYIVNLEKIDMPWVVAAYTQNKQLALNQLVQVSNGNIESLKIAAKLAHKYGDKQVIRQLIPLMLRANVQDEMIPLLLKILYPPDNIIYTAWRSIILIPFQKADYPITEKQKNKCLTVLNLLPVCPIIKDEDLVEIWKHSVRCKCLGLGCLILPYITAQTRQTLVELQKIDKRNLIIALKNLQAETYLVSGAMYVLEKLLSKANIK